MLVSGMVRQAGLKVMTLARCIGSRKSVSADGAIEQLGLLNEQQLYRHVGRFSRNAIQKYYHNDPWICNFIVNAWEFANAKTTLLSYPYDLAFAINSACNANCIFCLTRPYRRKSANRYFEPSDWKRFETLLKYAHAVGIPGPGEPLMHPRFQELIENLTPYIDERCNVYLITNGLLLGKYFEFLIQSRIKTFDISLNAASADTHKEILGLKEKRFDEIVDNLKMLIDARDAGRRQISINISYVVTNQNLHEISKFVELGNTLKVDGIYIRPFVNDSACEIDEPPIAELFPIHNPRREELIDAAVAAIRVSAVPVYAKPWTWCTHKINNPPHRCSLVYNKLYLHNEFFRIWPCCLIGHLDNIHPIDYEGTTDFHEVWNGPIMVGLRQSLLNGPLNRCCKTCQINLKY